MRKLFFIIFLGLITGNLTLFSKNTNEEILQREKNSKKEIAKISGSILISAYCFYFICKWPHASDWDKNNIQRIVNKKPFPLKYAPCAPFVLLAENIGKLFPYDLKLETSLLYTIPAIIGWKFGEYGVTKLYKILQNTKNK